MLIVPIRDWKYSEFTKYVIENSKEVFNGPKRRWLKMYYVYIDSNALDLLEKKLQPIKQGDLLRFEMGYKESASQTTQRIPYYMVEIEPGLFCFYTSSTREGYEKTLRRVIQRTRGMSEMWIRPEIFERIKEHVITNFDAKIDGFLSLSSKNEEEEARVRPRIRRRIHYRGSDGIDAINELKMWYGVSPISIDFVLDFSKFQITHEGLFTLKHPNEMTFRIVNSVLELIREEQIAQKDIAKQLRFDTEQDNHNKRAIVESGKINLLSYTLTQEDTHRFINKFDSNFAFIDAYSSPGSVDFAATVVDRHKGSIFDVSVENSSITLIPRFETTYESFLNFYRKVVETFDRKATFKIYS